MKRVDIRYLLKCALGEFDCASKMVNLVSYVKVCYGRRIKRREK